jgi:hypothetical protein
VDASVDDRLAGVRHDGTLPYVVKWTNTGRKGYYFPGPGARVEPVAEEEPQRHHGAPHVRRWTVNIDVFESDEHTSAHAALVAESPTRVVGTGHAQRGDDDGNVPEIGAEVAVARALHRLSERLLGIASDDLDAVQCRPRRARH